LHGTQKEIGRKKKHDNLASSSLCYDFYELFEVYLIKMKNLWKMMFVLYVRSVSIAFAKKKEKKIGFIE
jgi:cyanate lyase